MFAFAALVSLAVAACGSDTKSSSTDSPSATASPATTAPSSGTGGTVSASSEPGAAAGPEVKVSFLTHWPPETVAKLEAAAAKYKETHPNVTIDVNAVPFGDLLTTVRSTAGGDSAPTIAGIYDLWLPELVRDGIVAKASEAVGASVTADFAESTSSAATVDGTVYGVPNEIDLYSLNYNKKLFAAAGITDPPATWDALRADAKKLTVTTDGKITQQGFGLINSWAAGTVHPFASLLESNGGTLIKDGVPQLDSPAATETFQLIEDLIKADKSTDPTMGTADANTTGPFLDNFVAGKTAMIIMANWWESTLRTGMGDAAFADIATAPIPVGPNGDGPHSVSYSWMTVVSSKASADEQAAAWDFLLWLNGPDSGTAGVSGMGDLLQSMGILPSRTSDIVALADRLNTPFLKGYVDELANARPFPIVLGGQEFTESLQKQIEALEFGQTDAASAQKTAQSDAKSILESAQG
ncbi:MAG: extracellular solute-binding protein [Ilumatobacteraceae bacterium]